MHFAYQLLVEGEGTSLVVKYTGGRYIGSERNLVERFSAKFRSIKHEHYELFSN